MICTPLGKGKVPEYGEDVKKYAGTGNFLTYQPCPQAPARAGTWQWCLVGTGSFRAIEHFVNAVSLVVSAEELALGLSDVASEGPQAGRKLEHLVGRAGNPTDLEMG